MLIVFGYFDFEGTVSFASFLVVFVLLYISVFYWQISLVYF